MQGVRYIITYSHFPDANSRIAPQNLDTDYKAMPSRGQIHHTYR